MGTNLMRSDGPEPLRLVNVRTGEQREAGEPAVYFRPQWSPDGRLITATHAPSWERGPGGERPPLHLMVIDPWSGESTRLENADYPVFGDVWSPDSRYLAVAGAEAAAIVDTRGEVLASVDGAFDYAVWSHDSAWVALRPDDRDGPLVVLGRDGTVHALSPDELGEDLEEAAPVSWSLEGALFAIAFPPSYVQPRTFTIVEVTVGAGGLSWREAGPSPDPVTFEVDPAQRAAVSDHLGEPDGATVWGPTADGAGTVYVSRAPGCVQGGGGGPCLVVVALHDGSLLEIEVDGPVRAPAWFDVVVMPEGPR